ncbi:efflux RND transporter periplasmic adaptor subunit [Megalodesulfovibrio paquesii]
MRTSAMFLQCCCLAALLLLSACSEGPQAADAQPAGPAMTPEVTVLTIAPRPLTLTTELPGRTSAHLVSDVRPQVNGIIQKRMFTEGAEVKEGEILYKIDPAHYQATYNNAKAAVVKAEANLLPAKLRAERTANLARQDAVSKQDNDDAQATSRQAEAEVLAAKAALDTARINLEYTDVRAPISGRIGKSAVTPGALVTANQAAALATIQSTDPIYVDLTQSSAEVLRLRRELESGKLHRAEDGGATVTLLMEDGHQYPHEGKLQFADITVDQSTGMITLRAEFPNPNRLLLPGLYVRAVLAEGVDEQAILVPQAAVSRDPKGTALAMVVKPDGVVEARPLVVDRVVGDSWLVSAGLSAGEKIVVDGLQKAKPGATVKTVEAAPAQAHTPAALSQAESQPGAAANAPAVQ